MSGNPINVSASPTAPPGRRAARHAATRAEIIAAAWALVRESGLAGLSMRELGDRVGMRAQSVYSYFDSKTAILDAMFREGYEEFVSTMEPLLSADATRPTAYLRGLAQGFFTFCVDDPPRFQLLFLRTVPGFEPSAESYAVAVHALSRMQDGLARAGIVDPHATDLSTAVMTGLASQQLANDPGGDRWARLVDRAVAMLMAETAPDLSDPTPTNAREGSTP